MEHDFFDMYLEEMRSITPLERDEMVSVLEGTARGDAGARSRLVEGCLGKVLEMVREYGDSELPLSDLVQEANTALMLAAIEYDGSEPWNELMTRRVKESVELALEEQRTENQIEETMAARVNVLQTVSQVLAKELGREATLEELSAKMKMSEDEVRDIMKLALDALTVNGEGQADAGRQEVKTDETLYHTPWTDRLECTGKDTGKAGYPVKRSRPQPGSDAGKGNGETACDSHLLQPPAAGHGDCNGPCREPGGGGHTPAGAGGDWIRRLGGKDCFGYIDKGTKAV